MAKIYFIYNGVYFESEDTIAKSILDKATIITEEEFQTYSIEVLGIDPAQEVEE